MFKSDRVSSTLLSCQWPKSNSELMQHFQSQVGTESRWVSCLMHEQHLHKFGIQCLASLARRLEHFCERLGMQELRRSLC